MRIPVVVVVGLTVVTGLSSSCSTDPVPLVVDVGGQRFDVEVPTTIDEQQLGLAGRRSIPDATGMLFLFPDADAPDATPTRMTTAGMLVDLDIAWIREGKVVAVHTAEVCPSSEPLQCAVWESPGPVDGLLEVGSGQLASITPNTSIVTIARDGVVTPIRDGSYE